MSELNDRIITGSDRNIESAIYRYSWIFSPIALLHGLNIDVIENNVRKLLTKISFRCIISNMNEQIILKNRVKELRARLDLRQSDLAREIGVTRQTILAIEKGRLNPSINIALKAARVLREPVDYIFYLENRDMDVEQGSNPAHKHELVHATEEPAAIWDFAK